MHSFGKLSLCTAIVALGGCILVYDYNEYDPEGGGANTNTGGSGANGGGAGGGEPSASSSDSSSSSSSGGAAGAGGAGSCTDITCGTRPKECPPTDCLPLGWAHRIGSAKEEQNARSVAISSNGTRVAIAGVYLNEGFFVDVNASISLPDASPMGSFTEGFVAVYDGALGTPLWARSLGLPVATPQSYREARSVAFDADGNVIVAGMEKPNQQPTQLLLRKFESNNPDAITPPAWTKTKLGAEDTHTEAVAIATHETDIYLLGRSEGSSATIYCTKTGATALRFEPGMFVAKLNADGDCIWLRAMNSVAMDQVEPMAITAKNAPNNGVWITGTIKNNLVLTPLALMPGLATKPFVIRFDDMDGKPSAAYAYTGNPGNIRPTAIDTDGAGTVFMSGELSSKTEFSPTFNLGDKGAFVVEIKPESDPYLSSIKPIVLPVEGAGIPGARATGVGADATTIYVAGTFAGTLHTPASDITVTSVNAQGNAIAAPFLAVFQRMGAATPTLSSINAFRGKEASIDQGKVFLAAQPPGVALAGSWFRNLDFTTFDRMVGGLLQGDPFTTNGDAFVAKFGPLSP